MRERRLQTFAGRMPELDAFRSILAGTAPHSVLFVSGAGGVGKTTLLQRLACEALEAGRPVVEVDGHDVDPSPDAFTAAADAAMRDPRAVLLIDTFERLQGLEKWLRNHFLPRLPDGVVVVVAGRRPPHHTWSTDPAWSKLLALSTIGDFSPEEAQSVLRAWGVPDELRDSLLGFAGGHPLALSLAAVVAVRDTTHKRDWTPTHDVIATLLQHLVGDIPSPEHRLALETCAHALTTTEELLRTVVGEQAPELFRWLRQLPFIESGRNGLYPHDVVREALESDLLWRDRERYGVMHNRIREYLEDQLRSAPESAIQPVARSLTYLMRNGPVKISFTSWLPTGEVHEDRYRPSDREHVLQMVSDMEGPESSAIASFWLDRQPQAMRLYRDPHTGSAQSFLASLHFTDPTDEELSTDPVVAAAWRHARTNGLVGSGEVVGVARYFVNTTHYQRPHPTVDMMRLMILAEWFRTPRLAWSFVVLRDRAYWEPELSYLDLNPLGTDVEVGGRAYTLFARDWQRLPTVAWAELLSARLLYGPDVPVRQSGTRHEPIGRPEFDTALQDVLRFWHRPQAMSGNPLLASRLVIGADLEQRQTALRRRISGILDQMAADPHTARGADAVRATFLGREGTQRGAAARLGVPFGTYRRHLKAGLEFLCDLLWQLEASHPPQRTDDSGS